MIDEEEKKVTLVPGATLALFWFKTPQQASWDLVSATRVSSAPWAAYIS